MINSATTPVNAPVNPLVDMPISPRLDTPSQNDSQKDSVNQDNTQNKNSQSNPQTFDTLGLARPILSALKSAGYTTPTPIQAQAIPLAISGQDLLLSAQTGSGKTAAFVLPILHKLASDTTADKKSPIQTRAVILTPTRELAMQVQDNVRKYANALRGVFSVPLVGGTSYTGQIRALKKGVQIIIATPGRFIDHLNSGRIDLSCVDTLVLDEADRMLDMGFSDDINTIVDAMPDTRQTVMSSATWDGMVGKIAQNYTNNPTKIAIEVESAHIEESVFFCDDFQHKNAILADILNNPEITQAVIFTATKRSTEELAERLNTLGHKSHYLHGDLPQGKRNRIVSDIKSKKAKLLIATDVAARGIDIAGISHVINYDLPRQAEDYVHRIGRSGRAGRSGVAYNLCSIDDKNLLSAINRYLSRTMTISAIEGLEPVKNTGLKSDRQGDTRKKGVKNSRFKGGGKSRFDDRKTDGYRTQRTSDSNPRRTRDNTDSQSRFDNKNRFKAFDSNNQPRSDRYYSRDDRVNRSNDKSFNTNDKAFNTSRTGSSFGERTERSKQGRFDNKPYAKKDSGFKDRNFKDNGFKGNNFKESGFKESRFKESGVKENGFKSKAFDSQSFKDKPFKDQKNKSFGDFKQRPKGEFRAKKQPSETVFHAKKRRFGDK